MYSEVEVSSWRLTPYIHVCSRILLTDNPLDPLSHVDLMKSRGLDASREARLTYAQQHGIGGVPFSASWGDAMLKHLQRNG